MRHQVLCLSGIWSAIFAQQAFCGLRLVLNGSTPPKLQAWAFKNYQLRLVYLGGFIALVSTVWWPQAFDDGYNLDSVRKNSGIFANYVAAYVVTPRRQPFSC